MISKKQIVLAGIISFARASAIVAKVDRGLLAKRTEIKNGAKTRILPWHSIN